MPKPRGRPRSYDPEAALDAALETFWAKGYDGTSLEDLRRATGMNRPSLYAAFGDKASIYRRVLERFEDRVDQLLAPILQRDADLRQDLIDCYLAIVGIYASTAEPGGGRGCLVLSTAGLSAPTDPAAAQALGRALTRIDGALVGLFRRARLRAVLPEDADLDGLAWMAAAIQHSLSIRARAGASADELAAAVEPAVDHLLAAAGAGRPRS